MVWELRRQKNLERADAIRADVVKLHARFSIESIAEQTGESIDVVKAAVYLAIQRKEIPAYD